MRLSICAAIVTIFGGWIGTAADPVTTYTDRPTFIAAESPNLTEDFNGFAGDAGFLPPTTVSANNMTLSTTAPGAGGANTNKVDVTPFELAAVYTPNGTPYIIYDLWDGSGNTARIQFDYPVIAWGADFIGVSDDFRVTRIEVYDPANQLLGGISIPSDPDPFNARFVGFGTNGWDIVDRIVFVYTSSTSNDVFGVDNVLMTVPEPASLALLGLAALGVAVRRRRRSPVLVT